MLLGDYFRNSQTTTVLGVTILVTILTILTALPALAIDARNQGSAIVPIKGPATPPDGAADLCAKYSWACEKSGQIAQGGEGAMGILRAVNSQANRTIKPISDLQQYQIKERWSLPTREGGDCEDYALAKKKELIRIGLSTQQFLIATVLDRKRQSHAVLIVKTGMQDLVLDNLTNKILPWNKTGYTFLRMQDPRNPRLWVSVLAGGILPLS